MRFEKINENKIRIFLNNTDLIKNNIDYHAFMSNPIESQSLFLKVLDHAQKEIGFNTKNYDIKIEAMEIASQIFILTITRVVPKIYDGIDFNNKIHIRKKQLNNDMQNAIYVFNTFDDFCLFCLSLKQNHIQTKKIAKNISLLEYNNNYYLFFSSINLQNSDINKVFLLINEFSKRQNDSPIFRYKIYGKGNIIMKNNAIEIANKYF